METIDYTKRREEMWDMRYVEGKTLKEIGAKYRISRERVRQILGNTGKDFRSKWTRDKISSGEITLNHWTEIESAPGVKREWMKDWGKHRHAPVSGTSHLKGFEFEERASRILAENGISNKTMPTRCSYNIETANGAKIGVTVSDFDVSTIESQNTLYPTYPVAFRNKELDFLFAFLPDGKGDYTYFVIPNSALQHLKSKDARVRIPFPPMSQKPSKWHKYHEAIEQIKNYTV